MTVRRAKRTDIPAIIEMAARFHAVAGLDTLPFDEKHMEKTVEFLLLSDDAVIFVLNGGGGILAGQVMKSLFGPGIVASEMIWWVNPGNRGGIALLHHFERWAKARGASLIGMTARDDRVGNFLERRGYQRAETHFAIEVE